MLILRTGRGLPSLFGRLSTMTSQTCQQVVFRLGRLSMAALTAIMLAGCDPSPSTTPDPASDNAPIESTTAEPRRGYEIPIPMMEYWEGTQVPKYTYEMRFDADGKLHRNGWAQAFYSSGNLEREGSYKFNPTAAQSDRVGLWTYYDPDGSVNRTEDRAGEPIWTAADQLVSAPGTAP